MNRRAVDGVRRFLASPNFREIEMSDPKFWLPFEELDSFDFEGTSDWANHCGDILLRERSDARTR